VIVDNWSSLVAEAEACKVAIFESDVAKLLLGNRKTLEVRSVIAALNNAQRRFGDMFKKRAWIFPLVGGGHWTLAVIDFESSQLLFLNSTGGTNLGALRRLAALLKIATCKGYARPLDSSWQVAALRTLSPQQLDGYNCGHVVLLVIRHILSGAKLPSHRLTESVMDTYRNVLTAELLQGSLLS
jgi:Ulp1 family protease